MKTVLITMVISFSAFTGYGQTTADSMGFTHKAEAKNRLVDGVKEGKWIEYIQNDSVVTTDTNAPFYRLTIYVSGRPYGIVRGYFKDGALRVETPYKDGVKSGWEKVYYKNGKIWKETPYEYGELNENLIVREYYEDGEMKDETITYQK